MKTIAIILLTFILSSPLFAGDMPRKETPVFTDDDLERYKKESGYSAPKYHDEGKKETIEKNLPEGSRDIKDYNYEVKNERSESEKKALEGKFNRIVLSMISQLEAGNIEGALGFFSESSRETYRQTFQVMIDSNTVRDAFEGYLRVELESIYDHSAQCGMIRKERGELFSYPVSFIEDREGHWQIYGF